MKTLWSAALVLLLVALAPTAEAALTVKGSDTMVILGQRWAEAYMKKNPAAKIQVTGGGSGTGIASLVNGSTEIAMASRAMKPGEQAKVQARFKTSATEIPVAKDGVAFYVHASNPVDTLTVEQLRDIYLGDITNWKQVGGKDAPIVLYSRESSSGTYVFVKEELLENEDYAPSAQTLPGTAAIVNAVGKESNAIGYGGAAYASGIKEVKVKSKDGAFLPSAENVKSGKYALSRNLFFYVRGTPNAEAKQYIDFALSPEGQKIVSEVGYFPLK